MITKNAPQESAHITIADCPICSQLDEIETSFYKYGWDDMDRPLPKEAARLVDVTAANCPENEFRFAKRCPICGTFYLLTERYDYYVNGSEDEEILCRLTPTQVRHFLTDDDYETAISQLLVDLSDPQPLARRFAVKCLVSHHLNRGEYDALCQYIEHTDQEIVKGGMLFLRQLVEDDYPLPAIDRLNAGLHPLAASSDTEIAYAAKVILKALNRQP